MTKKREYKSSVFSMLLEDKENALEVFNLLNHSDCRNPEEVEMIRLENGIALSRRNDAAFIVDMQMNFYEHQSTYNPNMPLRSLIYLVNSLEQWIKKEKKDLFSRKIIKIPTPHFIVFYNGEEKRAAIEQMKLSDAFSKPTENPEIELLCTVYNINTGYNEELLAQSKVLKGYMYFVNLVKKYHLQDSILIGEAIELAIEDCIANGILADFFQKRKEEVKGMALDFTWEVREELIREEAIQEGLERGLKEGIEKGKNQGLLVRDKELIEKWTQKGMGIKEIAEMLDQSESYVESILLSDENMERIKYEN